MKENINVVARFTALLVVLINMILTAIGINPIPASEDVVYEVVSIGLTLLATVWMGWKNNSVTKEAKVGDMVITSLKAGVIAEEDIIKLIDCKGEDLDLSEGK